MRRRAVALLALLPLIAPALAFAVATIAASPNSLSFATRCVFTDAEDQPVRLTNTDDEAAALDVRIEISPSVAAGVFPLGGVTADPSLGPGEEVDFRVGFRPEAAGTATARAIVRYDAVVPPEKSPKPNPSGGPPSPSPSPSETPTAEPSPSTTPRRLNIPLSGAGIQRFAAASPGFVNFGPLRVGRRAPARTITILNDGDTPLNVSRIFLSGRNAGDFSLEATAPVRLTEGSPTTAQVGFRPRGVGGRIASLVIESDSCDGVFTVPLAGIGVQPDIVTDPLKMDFGIARPGEAKRDFLDVINQGGLELTIEEMEITGPDAAAFEFRRLPRFPHDLAPGEKIEARVTLRSEEPGDLAASIVITSNDPDDEGRWEVPLAAQVVAPSPSPSPTPSEAAPPPPPVDTGGFDLTLGEYIPEIAVGGAVLGFFVLLVVVRRFRGIPE